MDSDRLHRTSKVQGAKKGLRATVNPAQTIEKIRMIKEVSQKVNHRRQSVMERKMATELINDTDKEALDATIKAKLKQSL